MELAGKAVRLLFWFPHATTPGRSYEEELGLNKLPLERVGDKHGGEHPFNQSKGQT
jgi:hypothetical protein